jgi:orotate phosphoribosyltransferase
VRNATLSPARELVEFLLSTGVLAFGDFQTKSGRRTPYFLDFARLSRGSEVRELGRFYARAIRARLGDGFDVLFGPAYKGIPLVVSTAMALAAEHGRDVPYCFNRKEAKDHGEGGTIVGAPLKGRVLIVDDVITAGTAIRESVEIIRAQGATPAGVLIALDREERGRGERSAVQEVQDTFGLPVVAVLRLRDLMAHLEAAGDLGVLQAVRAYRDQYGV